MHGAFGAALLERMPTHRDDREVSAVALGMRKRTPTATAKRGRRRRPHRPPREGAPTRWPDVRVKPGSPPERAPRALTQPRWLVDATFPTKKRARYLSARQAGACGRVGGDLCSWETGATRALLADIRRSFALARPRCAEEFKRKPAESAPFRPDSDDRRSSGTNHRPPGRSHACGVREAIGSAQREATAFPGNRR